ncbi:CBL-interacting protein kinase 7-like protein [Carex littledalei]|uniref:non-specific serine/threonine protein kinase n=1 Tax=Carex littledalei TaxID=544730 RepID=A0A833QEK9_9POAL|nr:CBL-interacting protein kinase 7-like protein [Carex littledalei]
MPMEAAATTTATSTATAKAATPKSTKKTNQLLGKYELTKLLGRGTFAKVYHAVSLSDGTQVAIKVIDKSSPNITAMPSDLLLREIHAMRRLSHPHILRLHEVLATCTRVFLVMDYAPKGDLAHYINRFKSGRLAEPVARRFFLQLVSALRYCHKRGVSHRDIKPQNLLLSHDGTLKLSDFGLSALPEQIGADGCLTTACGTPAYAAPEVMRKHAYDGPKADAWSCGVILYNFLSGSLPFEDHNLPLMYKKMLKREFNFPSWFSPTARKLISKLLDPNPVSRLSIEGLVDHPWFKRSLSLDSQLGLLNSLTMPPCHLASSNSSSAVNAFDIISLSSGLDLSGLFDEGKKRKEVVRFTSVEPVQTILQRINDAGEKLGYVIGKKKSEKDLKGYLLQYIPGLVMLSVNLSEVVAPLLLVELRVEEAGDVVEEEVFKWEELRTEIEDVVKDWHNGKD